MKMVQSREKISRYLAVERVGVALIIYMAIWHICDTLFFFETDNTTLLIWTVMAGVVFGIWKISDTKAVNIAVLVYVVLLLGWFLHSREEDKWKQASFFFGSLLMLQILYYFLKKAIVRILCGYILLGVLICSRFFGTEYTRPVIAMCIFLFLYAVSETIAFFYMGNTKLLVLLYAAIALLTVFTPVSKEPYDWGLVYRLAELAQNAVKGIAAEIQYQFSDIVTDDNVSFRVTGYSDGDMNLFQEMISQDIEQLVLQGDYTKGNLYLKGRVCNDYIGSGWKNETEGTEIDYRTDALMTLYVIFQETEEIEELNRFMEIKEQEVIYKNIKTESLFYPLKLLSISEQGSKALGDQIQADKVNKRGHRYTYIFLDLDYANVTLSQIMNSNREVKYEKAAYERIYTNLEKLYHIKLEKMPYETFCQQAQLMKKMTELTCDTDDNRYISEKVRSLSDELTKQCKTDYEACKLLEEYLYQYHYNLSPEIPQNVNVLDYFLFEGMEGYCAHYATALAAMLQSRGIPARVAEGFLVNYKQRTDIYAYLISSKLAHVWVEAYLDGFGWVRLEPTAVYREAANRTWYAEKAQFQETEAQEYESEMVGNSKSEDAETMNYMYEQATKEQGKQTQTKVLLSVLKLLFGMLLSIFLVVVAVLWYQRLMLQRSIRPDVILPWALVYLEKKYMVKLQTETIREYFERICTTREPDEEEISTLMMIAETMDIYWYGDRKISDETIIKIKEYIK